MAELMPPIGADYLALADFIVRPELAVTVLVEMDRLDNVVFERHPFGKLRLIVRCVETHFELAEILFVHLNVIYGFEVGFGEC